MRDHSAGSSFEATDQLGLFALCAAFPRADYEGHADCGHGPRRVLGRLSPPCSLALLHLPSQLSHVPIHRLHGIVSVVGSGQPLPAYRGSRVDTGEIRFVRVILLPPTVGCRGELSSLQHTQPTLAVPSGQVLRQGTTSP
jgi:hypothetical protein